MSNVEPMKQMFFEGRLNGLIAAVLLALAVVMHGLLPRYEVTSAGNGDGVQRFDNWTGQVCLQRIRGTASEWRQNPRNLWVCHTRTMLQQ